MTLRTFLHVLHAPLGNRTFIFAEHTFARTRGIHEDTIEEFGQFVAEISRRVVGNYGIAVAPFLDILRKNKHALAHYLVADEQSLVTKKLADEGGLATRRCTEVKHDAIWLEVLVQYLTNKHTAGLLHVVATRMEERVKSELWTTAQIVSIFVPRHLFGVAIEGETV